MKPSQKLDHCAGINIKTSCYLPSMHAYLQLTSAKFRINVIVRKVLRKFTIMSSISDTFMYALPNIFKLCEKNHPLLSFIYAWTCFEKSSESQLMNFKI